MKTYKTVAEINKAIDSIITRGKRLDNDIHKCAVSIAEHVNVHHEVSLVNRLVESMPKGSRVNAIKEWFVRFAKVTYNEEEKTFEPLRADAKDLTDAIAMPWYEFKKDPDFKVPSTVVESLQSLLKKQNSALKNEKATDKDKAEIRKEIKNTETALKALGVSLED